MKNPIFIILIVLAFAFPLSAQVVDVPSEVEKPNDSKFEILAAGLIKLIDSQIQTNESLQMIGTKVDRTNESIDEISKKLDELIASIKSHDAVKIPIEKKDALPPFPIDVPQVAIAPLHSAPKPPPFVYIPPAVPASKPVIPNKASPQWNVLGSWPAAHDEHRLEQHLAQEHGHTNHYQLTKGQNWYVHDADHNAGFQPTNGVKIQPNWFCTGTNSVVVNPIVSRAIDIPGTGQSPRPRTNNCPNGVCPTIRPLRLFLPRRSRRR